MQLQSSREGIEGQRWNGVVLDLKVVGENEAGHNNQGAGATLAMNASDNEWLIQLCRDRRCILIHQRRACSAQ